MDSGLIVWPELCAVVEAVEGLAVAGMRHGHLETAYLELTRRMDEEGL